MQKDERSDRHRKGQQNISSSFHAYVGQACIGAVDSGVQKSAMMLVDDKLVKLPRDVRRAKPEKEDGHMLGLFFVFRFVHMISTTDPRYIDDNNENSVKEIMSIGNLPGRKPWDAVITLCGYRYISRWGQSMHFP